jgi:hypothetical protein
MGQMLAGGKVGRGKVGSAKVASRRELQWAVVDNALPAICRQRIDIRKINL